MHVSRIVPVLAAPLLLAALAADPVRGAAPKQPAQPVTVFAAASLTDAFGDLGKLFHKRHPRYEARFSFGGSAQLALQLAQGAGADVFACADDRTMRATSARSLVDGVPVTFARNQMVVIVPAANPGHVTALQDLVREGLKLVLCADAVPAGHYARQVIANLATLEGYPSEYARRLFVNVVSQEDNVRSVASKVALGEADAGFVYRSDVTRDVRRRVKVIEIPPLSNVTASYPAAVLRKATAPEGARAFLALLTSREGQAVLKRHGFLPATEPAKR